MKNELIKKYNVAGPRYTSYPTVPYWNTEVPKVEDWKEAVKKSFTTTNATDGISIYIHLPFCESLCTYCGCNTRITKNHAVENKYIAALLKEWKMYLEVFEETPRIREIHLGGGTPTFFSSENLEKLINGILSTGIVCDDAAFSFEAHPNNTTVEHLQTLYDLGFRRLSLGIQDFDIAVQTIVNRVQPIENVEQVVNAARSIGYTSINFDLIYGLPLQTMYSVIDTIHKVNVLRPDRIAFYSYAHIPWVKPGQRKFTEKDLPVDEAKRALYEKGKELFEEMGYVEIGMDHFALKSDGLYKAAEAGKLHRNFMGYSDSYTELMVGLGVSSISDTWNAFGQNVKKVEEYYELIDKNELPIFKGHFLTNEDELIRKHILNIMCRFQTSWQQQSEQCDAVFAAITRLAEMEKDKPVVITPFHLKVTEAGRPFIRNICMSFDARLWSNLPQSQIFSSTV